MKSGATTPFERFFEGTFETMLKNVKSEPGIFSDGGSIQDASWDRKAAFLLWDCMGRSGEPCRYCDGSGWFYSDKDLGPCSCRPAGEHQFETPNGGTCKNGHGGAEPDCVSDTMEDLIG